MLLVLLAEFHALDQIIHRLYRRGIYVLLYMYTPFIFTSEWCEGLKLQDLHWGRVPIDRVVQITQRMGEESVQECLVEAIHDFQANEEDELSLEKGDVVKVSRKMAGTCSSV